MQQHSVLRHYSLDLVNHLHPETFMKRLLQTITALLLTSTLHAAPANDAAIEKLMEITKAEATMESMYANLEQIMRSALQQESKDTPQTAQQQRMQEAFPAKFAALVRQEMTWSKIKPSYVQLYRETFSQEEIDGLISFYQSPAGLAYIDKMPTLIQKSLALSETQMQTFMPKLHELMKQLTTENQKSK
jgi:uncharacterized protein